VQPGARVRGRLNPAAALAPPVARLCRRTCRSCYALGAVAALCQDAPSLIPEDPYGNFEPGVAAAGAAAAQIQACFTVRRGHERLPCAVRGRFPQSRRVLPRNLLALRRLRRVGHQQGRAAMTALLQPAPAGNLVLTRAALAPLCAVCSRLS